MKGSPRLVAMANDIAAYFETEPDRAVAAHEIATHLRRFWAPRMRQAIAAHLASGGEGLGTLAQEGVRALIAMESETAS